MNSPSSSPPDAPPRPIVPQFGGCLFGGIVTSGFIFYAFKTFSNPKNGWIAVAVILGLTLLYILTQWRKSDKLGWYELKPIQGVLPLQYGPILYGKTDYRTLFDEQGIYFGNQYHAFYPQITHVETVCENILLKGVKIYFNNGHNESILNYSADGEPVRTIIALLRQKAPHAQFIGPRWVGDGYVPRGGFNSLDAGGGGGNGP